MEDKKEQEQQHRHSLAHLLAAAVLDLWPDTKHTIGPAIDNGFYYDFELSTPISEDDLRRIEKKMREIGKTWKEFSRSERSIDDAKKEYPDNTYKRELIDDLSKDADVVTFYTSGTYVDLCRGGHVENFQDVDLSAFTLDRIAGAYWRGDEKNTMLTRIYGLAFLTKQELKEYRTMREEAKKRDHRNIGRALDLFTFSDLVGSGLPLWTPMGTRLRIALDAFVWELRSERGYERVEIPHITKKDLYETSGHWEKFADELFRITTREGHEFAMKPMNCPHHTQIYARRKWSYRELPQRYANTTTCYRDEQTGELHGISRTRAFTQDDAHVFCRTVQMKDEFLKVWDIIDTFYSTVGYDALSVELSLHDPTAKERYLGTAEMWAEAEQSLRDIATERDVSFEEKIGEAAFYGPKVDFIAKDSIGRKWQVATIQLDMNMPERFDLSCVNESGDDERIVMIHAAIMGSIERFLSTYIEHTAGAFPTWLAPVQVGIVPVGEAHLEASHQLARALRKHNIRAEVDEANETVGKKIRNATSLKYPYVLVVGDKEQDLQTVAVRRRGQRETTTSATDTFIAGILDEIHDRVA